MLQAVTHARIYLMFRLVLDANLFIYFVKTVLL